MITPTTELEAVNTMLVSIGESPVNRLNSGLDDANTALTILRTTSRQLQLKGWHFNTEEVDLTPDKDGCLMLPANTLKVNTNYEHIVQRGRKLYNRRENTYKFTESYKVEIVVALEFEELIEAARHYITISAARRFQDSVIGASDLHGFQQVDEMRAYAILEEAENEATRYNLFDNPQLRGMLNRSSSYIYRGR
jgi:hypothetical protein